MRVLFLRYFAFLRFASASPATFLLRRVGSSATLFLSTPASIMSGRFEQYAIRFSGTFHRVVLVRRGGVLLRRLGVFCLFSPFLLHVNKSNNTISVCANRGKGWHLCLFSRRNGVTRRDGMVRSRTARGSRRTAGKGLDGSSVGKLTLHNRGRGIRVFPKVVGALLR